MFYIGPIPSYDGMAQMFIHILIIISACPEKCNSSFFLHLIFLKNRVKAGPPTDGPASMYIPGRAA